VSPPLLRDKNKDCGCASIDVRFGSEADLTSNPRKRSKCDEADHVTHKPIQKGDP
jgi:hypothetical protein